jgi:FAD/FMN-containing dehydrogenase
MTTTTTTFVNWSRTVKSGALPTLRPRDEDELARGIDAHDGPVRVMGSGHSFSPLGQDEPPTLFVDAAAFATAADAVVDVDDDGCVWLGAATPLLRVHALLARVGRSLPNVGSISAQTLAGVTATGTHGTGRGQPCLSAAVAGVRLVDGNGRMVDVGDADLPAVALAVGTVGVVTRIKVRTVPLFYVAEERTVVDVSRLADVVAATVGDAAASVRTRISWVPYGKKLVVQRFFPVSPPTVLPARFDVAALPLRLEGAVLNRALFGGVVLGLTSLLPALAPSIVRWIEPMYAQGFAGRRVGRLYERINIQGVPRHDETEWAVPVDDAVAAVTAVRAAVEAEGHPLDFIHELRFAARDDLWLSPARGRDVAWVGIYQTARQRFDDVVATSQRVLRGFSGRPHWGKRFVPREGDAPWLPQAIGDDAFGRFTAVRQRFDPDGRFLGPFHRAVGLR